MVGEDAARWLGVALIALAAAGFVAAGVGLLASQEWWRVAAIASAGLSAVPLALFWHTWLVVGPLLDAAIVVALVWIRWPPDDVIA